MNIEEMVRYEILGSWWASWVPFHNLVARYMVWKTTRKMKRHNRHVAMIKKMEHGKSQEAVSA